MGREPETQNKIVRKRRSEIVRPSVIFVRTVNPGQIPGMHFPSKTGTVPAWIGK